MKDKKVPLLRSRLRPEGWTTSSEAYPASGLESWGGCSYCERLVMLALFLNELPSVTRTPNSMIAFSPPLVSVHVRELWPLFPHCEHVRDIFFNCVVLMFQENNNIYEKKQKQSPQSMQEGRKKSWGREESTPKVLVEYLEKSSEGLPGLL